MNSIFVREHDRKWVLGELQYVSERDPALTPILQKVLPTEMLPPNFEKDATDPFKFDVYAFGCLIEQLVEQLADEGPFQWRQLHALTKRMRSPEPSERPTLIEALRDPFFLENTLVVVVENFLKEIKTLDVTDKIEHFGELPARLRALPASTTVAYVLPLMLDKDLFSEPGCETLFRQLFVPLRPNGEEGILPLQSYALHVLPFIEEMLVVREYHVRIILLHLLDKYCGDLLEYNRSLLESTLIPELVIGLGEEDPAIHVASLCALASVVPRLCHAQLATTSSAPSAAGSAVSLIDGTVITGDAGRPPSTANTSTGSLASIDEGTGLRIQTSIPPVQQARSQPNLSPSGIPDAASVPGGLAGLKRKTSMQSLTDTTNSTTQPPSIRRMGSQPLLRPDQSAPLRKKQSVANFGDSPNGGVPEKLSLLVLVENLIIPHALNICVTDGVLDMDRTSVLEALFTLWKRMCVIEVNNKAVADVRQLTRSLLKSFHLIMKVLPAPARADFFARLVGDVDGLVDSGTLQCLIRIVELGTPFLRDESREVRRVVSDCLVRAISIITVSMDRAPAVSRKRDEGSVASKLKKVYGNVNRVRGVFPIAGPRATTPMQRSPYPIPVSKTYRLPSFTTRDGEVWEDWDEPFTSNHDAASVGRRSSAASVAWETDDRNARQEISKIRRNSVALQARIQREARRSVGSVQSPTRISPASPGGVMSPGGISSLASPLSPRRDIALPSPRDSTPSALATATTTVLPSKTIKDLTPPPYVPLPAPEALLTPSRETASTASSSNVPTDEASSSNVHDSQSGIATEGFKHDLEPSTVEEDSQSVSAHSHAPPLDVIASQQEGDVPTPHDDESTKFEQAKVGREETPPSDRVNNDEAVEGLSQTGAGHAGSGERDGGDEGGGAAADDDEPSNKNYVDTEE
ncbi:Protein-associating with the carboxyl-terminal domain of ezrin [Rhizophlyctis rosea]|nr:Protein-associating with the carboxyl-terminal domain of ezrin [Rhizophlyctis rosea]